MRGNALACISAVSVDASEQGNLRSCWLLHKENLPDVLHRVCPETEPQRNPVGVM